MSNPDARAVEIAERLPTHCPDCGHEFGREWMCGEDKVCGDCWNARQRAWQARMAVRQDPAQFDLRRLVNLLLKQHWMHECKIIPDYMPPFPRDDTRAACQVHYTYQSGTVTCLRYSAGPMQGYFWDGYGDDFHSPELALIGLSQAPAPPRIDVVITTHGN